MQPTKKKGYSIQDFISSSKGNLLTRSFNKQNKIIQCICGRYDSTGLRCYICARVVHRCLESKLNRGSMFECYTCLNRKMDPIYQVKQVLTESCFKIQNIFEYVNVINFEIQIKPESYGQMVQIRGIKQGFTCLSWPMQGSFYLNDQSTPFHQIKPLLSNSNRKARRQQYFMMPYERLKIGKNWIRFKIFNLDKQRFTAKYQYEQKGIYYMAVNLINKITAKQLITQTYKTRRLQMSGSLALLNQLNEDVEITSNKVCLKCPYTCQRIKVPIRGKYCHHFSCVCLQTLIASHMGSRYWGCPICQSKINEPYVDIWMLKMLKDNQRGDSVMVNFDGTYEWIGDNNKEIVSLDDSEQENLINQKVKFQNNQMIDFKNKQSEIVVDRKKFTQITQSMIEDRQLSKKQFHQKMVNNLRNISLKSAINQIDNPPSSLSKPSVQQTLKNLQSKKQMFFLPPASKIKIEVITDVKELVFVKQFTQDQLRKRYFYKGFTTRKYNSFFNEHKHLRKFFKQIE